MPDLLSPSEREVWPTPDGAASLDLSVDGETRVAIAGDWESQEQTVFPLIRRLRLAAPDVRTIVHVGDLQWRPPLAPTKRSRLESVNFVQKLDAELEANDVDRLLVTPGNHEWWERLHFEFQAHPNRFLRVGRRIWLAPRGMRFSLAGCSFLSMGGAASLDRDRGPYEIPTDEEIDDAIDEGTTDVLITHEAIDAGIPTVDEVIHRPGFSPERRRSSAVSRSRVTRLWNATNPTLTFHGHMHVAGSVDFADGRSVHSLNLVRQPRHMAILTLNDLGVTWLDDLPTGPFA